MALRVRPLQTLRVGPLPASAAVGFPAVQRRRYHEAVIDHFNNPRNVGKLDSKQPNVGSALVGKASCGDVIKLQIQVENDIIKNAKFKTFGCGSAIASASLVTEKIIGMNIARAAEVKNTEIAQDLKLPPVKMHCSVLAAEAIQAAIEDYHSKQPAASGD